MPVVAYTQNHWPDDTFSPCESTMRNTQPVGTLDTPMAIGTERMLEAIDLEHTSEILSSAATTAAHMRESATRLGFTRTAERARRHAALLTSRAESVARDAAALREGVTRAQVEGGRAAAGRTDDGPRARRESTKRHAMRR